MISQMADFTESAAFRLAGRAAFAEARIGVADVDHLMIYDAFAHVPIYGLEALGFTAKGEAGRSSRTGTPNRRVAAAEHQRRRPFLHPYRDVRMFAITEGFGSCAARRRHRWIAADQR